MTEPATIIELLRPYHATTLAGAIAEFTTYAEVERGWSEQTRHAYSSDLALFARWIAQTTPNSPPLDAVLTPETYCAFVLAHCRANRIGAARRWRLLATGRSLLAFASKKHLVPHVDLDLLERPKIPRRIPVHLELDQARRLRAQCEAMSPQDRAIVLTLLYTGIRAGELIGLNLADVGDTTIRVRGKGNKERLIPLPTEASAAIARYLQTRPATDRNALFTGAHGRISIRTVQRICHQAAHRAGLPGIHPHKLRHTYATLLHQAGADILEISHLLGHASIATTQIYTSTSAACLQAAVARMPALS